MCRGLCPRGHGDGQARAFGGPRLACEVVDVMVGVAGWAVIETEPLSCAQKSPRRLHAPREWEPHLSRVPTPRALERNAANPHRPKRAAPASSRLRKLRARHLLRCAVLGRGASAIERNHRAERNAQTCRHDNGGGLQNHSTVNDVRGQSACDGGK